MRILAFIAALLFAAPVFAQTQEVPNWYDNSGNLHRTGTNNPMPVAVGISSTGITPVVSASAEASHVLKASAGVLYSAYATNLTTTAGFLVVLNLTSDPGNGSITPLACAVLPASGTVSINFAPGPPQTYSTGITAVVTSANSCFTETKGTITAFISGSVQ